MDKLQFYLLILLIINIQYTTCAVTNPTPLDFVKTSCEITPYPDLCVNSLSNYASSIQGNPLQLAKAAIEVSLNTAKSVADYVSELARTSNLYSTELEALMKPCLFGDTSVLPTLAWAVNELEKMDDQFKVPNFVLRMLNIQRRVSSALTYQNTCFGGYDTRFGGYDGTKLIQQLEDLVNKEMGSLSEVTSNALAFVNRFLVGV